MPWILFCSQLFGFGRLFRLGLVVFIVLGSTLTFLVLADYLCLDLWLLSCWEVFLPFWFWPTVSAWTCGFYCVGKYSYLFGFGRLFLLGLVVFIVLGTTSDTAGSVLGVRTTTRRGLQHTLNSESWVALHTVLYWTWLGYQTSNLLKILPADLLKILPTDLLMIWLCLVQNFTYRLFQDLINRLAQDWFTDKWQNVSWYNLQNNLVMIRQTDISMIWQTNMFLIWFIHDSINKLVHKPTWKQVHILTYIRTRCD